VGGVATGVALRHGAEEMKQGALNCCCYLEAESVNKEPALMPTHLKKPPPPPVLLPIQLLRRKEATAVARASCLACGWRHASSYASPRAAWTAEHVCVRVCVCVCVCARAHMHADHPLQRLFPLL